jgi:hypothetical protein
MALSVTDQAPTAEADVPALLSRNGLAGLCRGPKQEGVQKEKGWYLAKQRVPMEGNLSEGHQGQAEETKMKQ